MSVLEITTLEDPILRQQADPVTRFDRETQALIDNMIETMREANGVGLAAPQIGLPLRLAVIETLPKFDADDNEIPDSRQLFVIANPEVVWLSPEMVDGIEGCLSIPGYVGEVARHQRIRVRAQDRFGAKIRLQLGSWTARIFQHEIDHLNGVLFIDRLTSPENFWSEAEYRELFEEEAEGVDS
jgi:peptide deformylase